MLCLCVVYVLYIEIETIGKTEGVQYVPPKGYRHLHSTSTLSTPLRKRPRLQCARCHPHCLDSDSSLMRHLFTNSAPESVQTDATYDIGCRLFCDSRLFQAWPPRYSRWNHCYVFCVILCWMNLGGQVPFSQDLYCRYIIINYW